VKHVVYFVPSPGNKLPASLVPNQQPISDSTLHSRRNSVHRTSLLSLDQGLPCPVPPARPSHKRIRPRPISPSTPAPRIEVASLCNENASNYLSTAASFYKCLHRRYLHYSEPTRFGTSLSCVIYEHVLALGKSKPRRSHISCEL